MRNPAFAYLLRAMAQGYDAQVSQQNIILQQAAIELEKLEKIYIWAQNNPRCPSDIHTILYTNDNDQVKLKVERGKVK